MGEEVDGRKRHINVSTLWKVSMGGTLAVVLPQHQRVYGAVEGLNIFETSVEKFYQY